MSDPRLARVHDAIEALRHDCPNTMATIRDSVNRGQFDGTDGALAQAVALHTRTWKPRPQDAERVDELIAALRPLAEPTKPQPLISDATLAKIVRLVLPLGAPDIVAIVSFATAGRISDALELARRCTSAGPRAVAPGLIFALEEANKEAARNLGAEVFCKGCDHIVCVCGEAP